MALEATRLALTSAAATHRGMVRDHNEDSYLERSDLGLWVVADGAGGHDSGDVASRTVVQALDSVDPPDTAPALMSAVRQAIEGANAELRRAAAERGNGAMMASTVVGLLSFDGHYAGFWVGDSRLYLLRGGRLSRVTHDHSVVQELIDSGTLDPDEAEQHPRRHQLTRAIGAEDGVRMDVKQGRLAPGDRFLLCSDGLYGVIGDDRIAHILARGPVEDTVMALVDTALVMGAPDNVTAVCVRCDPA
jgi:serine/threonine protein phosphatase PrpC